MQEVSVLYLSRVVVPPGSGFRVHTHDYWHFTLALKGRAINHNGVTRFPPYCVCHPPGKPNPGSDVQEEHTAFNVMFHVNDGQLADRLTRFRFGQLHGESLHVPVLEQIMNDIHANAPSQELVNAAIAYYLHLLLDSPQGADTGEEAEAGPGARALAFIEENFRSPLSLEDVAHHIERSRTYTSHLISSTTNTTFSEHIHAVRVRHACSLLAYSDIPLEEVAAQSGFTSIKNFVRVFGQKMGTTPNRYRTSHAEQDWYYAGDLEDLDARYTHQVYTYIPAARRCIDWETPLEYLTQRTKSPV